MTNPSWCKVFHNYGDVMLGWLEDICWRTGVRDQMVLLESKDGAHFKCHQWILARWSPYFEALFSRSFSESRTSRAKLENVDGDSLEAVLNYFLHGKLTVSADNSLRLLFAVEYLLLENLQDFVTCFIEENLQDVLRSDEFSKLELEQLWKLVPIIARGICIDKELGIETVVLYLQCWKLNQGTKLGICDDVRALIKELENILHRLQAPDTAYAVYKHTPNCVTKLFTEKETPSRPSGSLNDIYDREHELPPKMSGSGQLMKAHSTNELTTQEDWMFQLRSLISEGTTLMRQLSNQELQLPHDIPHECIKGLAVVPNRYILVLTDSRRLHLCPWNQRGPSQLVEAQCDTLLQCGREVYAVLQKQHIALWNCQLKMFEMIYSLSEHIIYDISWYKANRASSVLSMVIAHRAFPCNVELLSLDFDQVTGNFKQPPVRFHPGLSSSRLENPKLVALRERVIVLYEQDDADKVFVVMLGAQECRKVKCEFGINTNFYLNEQLLFYTLDNSMFYRVRYDFKDFVCEECGEVARLKAACIAPSIR